jgi:ribosomal protein S18 acetylase RimI-like enzyme
MPALFEPISRLIAFCKRHGLRATLERSVQFLRRLSSNRMVLFYIDLAKEDALLAAAILPDHLKVERRTSQAEISSQDWDKILNFWNPALCQRNFAERFQEGASLWLIWSGGELAGYGWTIKGCTIEPHYHPLGANDVHMFDYLVFPEFRGKNVNPSLVDYILHQMSGEGCTRAYIEVREWNKPQLNSLRKTRFQLLGVARKVSSFGRTIVEWSPRKHADSVQTATNQSPTRARLTAH